MTHLLWIYNNLTVWNKRTGQFIFQQIINALGCHGTGRANKRTGQDFSWK